jgi:hypothetical protein
VVRLTIPLVGTFRLFHPNHEELIVYCVDRNVTFPIYRQVFPTPKFIEFFITRETLEELHLDVMGDKCYLRVLVGK